MEFCEWKSHLLHFHHMKCDLIIAQLLFTLNTARSINDQKKWRKKKSSEPVVCVLRYLLQQKLAISYINVKTLELWWRVGKGEYVHMYYITYLLYIARIPIQYLHFWCVLRKSLYRCKSSFIMSDYTNHVYNLFSISFHLQS